MKNNGHSSNHSIPGFVTSSEDFLPELRLNPLVRFPSADTTRFLVR